ncbi:Putative cupredoxin, multicopper oxidase [Septoria linicola]|uniref:Cupredoxin, multicopper oxidase n=1 Tax=Septoria linicola TaxID=215465 RepID=A0A9Q9AYH9_9PEZI|nr:Putative cupredoxin, multicopper oxidase [Septoria linicola]
MSLLYAHLTPQYSDIPSAEQTQRRLISHNSVIDIILENDLPVDLPYYKHKDATFKLGSGSGRYPHSTVAEDLSDSSTSKLLNIENPTYGYMHELPAGGWMALRWKITKPAATMLTVYKVRYYIQGMQVALMEGDDAPWPEWPNEQRELPHVDFKMPEGMGTFD